MHESMHALHASDLSLNSAHLSCFCTRGSFLRLAAVSAFLVILSSLVLSSLSCLVVDLEGWVMVALGHVEDVGGRHGGPPFPYSTCILERTLALGDTG